MTEPKPPSKPELGVLWVIGLGAIVIGLGVAVQLEDTGRMVGFGIAAVGGLVLQVGLIATAVSLGIRHARVV